MGDVQSTQRGSRQDAAAEEENKEVDNPQTEQNTKHEVGPRTRTVLFSKVMLSCVTEGPRLLVRRANSSNNLEMKQRIKLINKLHLPHLFRHSKQFLNIFFSSVSL